ncbi:MAG: DUF4760 domain-containing protein [Cyclobacteriaceae bacterium]
MILEDLIDYAKIIGPLLTGASILLSAIYFIANIKRDRTKQTLDYWEKINQELKTEKRKLQRDYGDKIDTDLARLILEDKEERIRLNRVINIYERLAVGINLKVYDIRVLNRVVGQNIINNYNRYENYILERREKLDRPFAWKDFQTLSMKLQRLRKRI